MSRLALLGWCASGYPRGIDGNELRVRVDDVERIAVSTLNTLLSLALVAILGDYADTDDIMLFAPIRRSASYELLSHAVGLSVRTDPLRMTGAGELSVPETLIRVGSGNTDAVQNAAAAPRSAGTARDRPCLAGDSPVRGSAYR